MRNLGKCILPTILLTILAASSGFAEWQPNGTSVCTAANTQDNPQIVRVGSGETIIAWEDYRGAGADIYAQKLDVNGNPKWATNGIVVCSAPGNQGSPNLIPDGSGGCIIAWIDWRHNRDGSPDTSDVYVQRVSSSGSCMWTANGVLICGPIGVNGSVGLVSDGLGGAIIAWYRQPISGNSDIYAQRVSSTGASQWTAGGIAVCDATGNQIEPSIAPDGSGGAVISWTDSRVSDANIYAQRITSSGAKYWSSWPYGVAICTETGAQTTSKLVPDGTGGAIITWVDRRSSNRDIYARRILGDGSIQWTTGGVALCTASADQRHPEITTDGSGGAIVVWDDMRAGNLDIYAQRVSTSGTVLWTANGVPICTALNNQDSQEIISDDAGGAIIAWADRRTDLDIYAQRINGTGATLWAVEGAPIATGTSNQMSPALVLGNAGKAIITWSDDDIYASLDHYIASPVLVGPENGTQFEPDHDIRVEWYVVSGADKYRVRLGSPCGNGENLVEDLTWAVFNEHAAKTYYWQVQARDAITGAWGEWSDCRYVVVAPAYKLDVPVVQQAQSLWCWAACTDAVLSYFGENVDQCGIVEYARAVGGWGSGNCCDKPTPSICDHENDLYGCPQCVAEILSHWGYGCDERDHPMNLVDLENQIIARKPVIIGQDDNVDGGGHVVVCVGTWGDSVVVMDPLYSKYQTMTYAQLVNGNCAPWYHEPWNYTLKGIYDAPPPSPLGATAQIQHDPERLLLSWHPNTELDLFGYVVYRGSSADFVPGPSTRIASPQDTFIVDMNWRWDSGFYYKVSAIDVHGNESVFARPTTTGSETPNAPELSYLSQNYPNPFNPMTRITFGLSASSHVSLRIYDAAGQLVRILVNDERKAGVYAVLWDGRDSRGRAVASGIYFYRLNSGNLLDTKKMILLR